ncbi:MAG: hypothetical protein H6739_11640 [Alphaproteobacteria bacterium]|nr:hypothetical protein [Alphaproteobacteria bacterium]
MAVNVSQGMADFIAHRMASILRTPDGWGPPHAVELQLLLLIEMLHVVRGAPREYVDTVMERYARHLGSVIPGPPTPLALRLGLEDQADERFVAILRDFLNAEMRLGSEGRLVSEAVAPKLPARDDQTTATLVAEA